ncbi:hypothetical protein GMSM_27050 [Geomonas sp. Red276]
MAALLMVLVAAPPALAGGLGTPTLSPPLSAARFFDTDRLLTTAGVKYEAPQVTLEPELGLAYRIAEREQTGGLDESIHMLHAQAGGRLSLAKTMYLSAAAKLPVLTVENAANYTGQDLGSRRGYDFTRPFRSTPSWTGELGIHLGRSSDLTLYYDQSQIAGSFLGPVQQEERIGTRIIWRFK